mmetsp:Transcript_17385/g.26309  ORF Transcript_17385/g.26309 Transcript_17385/m.26309 type:complete len:148 (+) Transcript_17385:135-578(+)
MECNCGAPQRTEFDSLGVMISQKDSEVLNQEVSEVIRELERSDDSIIDEAIDAIEDHSDENSIGSVLKQVIDLSDDIMKDEIFLLRNEPDSSNERVDSCLVVENERPSRIISGDDQLSEHSIISRNEEQGEKEHKLKKKQKVDTTRI